MSDLSNCLRDFVSLKADDRHSLTDLTRSAIAVESVEVRKVAVPPARAATPHRICQKSKLNTVYELTHH